MRTSKMPLAGVERKTDDELPAAISFLISGRSQLEKCRYTRLLPPFAPEVLRFLDALSHRLMTEPEARAYTEVVALGFFLREKHLLQLRQQYCPPSDRHLVLGRGVVLHITPNNVPVNFAYSLITGLLTGNVNVVRLPSAEYPQVEVILKLMRATLQEFPQLTDYIILLRSPHHKEINEYLSSLCDLRVVWGGDETVASFRAAPLAPRALEVNFADRYSLAVLNSDLYLQLPNRNLFVHDFYNDTYLTDQNACTSPRLIVFTGTHIKDCQEDFYPRLHALLVGRYELAPVSAVDKLTAACLVAAKFTGCHLITGEDNLITRITVTTLTPELLDFKTGAGLFFEYTCTDLSQLSPLLNDPRLQTICYLEEKEQLKALLCKFAGRAVDRIVPIGQSLNFDLIWDGYSLFHHFTRTVSIS